MMKVSRKALALLGFFACAFAASGFDAYLQIDGVEGESIERNHPKWIEIQGFGQGAVQEVPASFTDLRLQKPVDSSSPVLAQSCAQGKRFAYATLELVTADTRRVRFYQIGLSNVFVTSVSTSGSAGGDVRPGESICLNFSLIGWNYTELDARGLPVGEVSAWWDILRDAGRGNVGTVFKVSATQIDAQTMRLSWPAVSGKTYRILGSPTVAGSYQFIQSITAASDNVMSVNVPITGGAKFFRVQEMQ